MDPDAPAVQADARQSGAEGAEAVRRARNRTLLRWLVAAAAVAVALLVHVHAALGSTTPVWGEDEIGPLADARVIAAVGEPWTLSKLAYYPGWSVLLAPLWWITDDPQTVYRLAVGLSVLVGVASIAPLAALARRLRVDAPTAVALAAVITASPARSVMSNYVIIENFLVLIVALTAVAAVRYWERPGMARGLVLASAAAYAFFTHGRAIAIPIATALALAVAAWRRLPGARTALVATVALSVGAFLVYRGIVQQLYTGSREGAAIETVTSVTPVGLLRTTVGQLWYQVAAWFGLTFLGGWVVVAAAVREVRRRRAAAAAWGALALAGQLGVVALFLGRVLTDPAAVGRQDYWFYGRYLDPFVVPLAVIGLAALVTRVRLRVVAGVLVGAAVVSAAFVVVNLSHVDTGAPVAAINIGGVLVWQVLLGVVPRLATVVAVLLLSAALLLIGRTGRLGSVLAVGGLGIWFAISSVVVDTVVVDHLSRVWLTSSGVADLVDEVAPDATEIGYDMAGTLPAEDNRVTFWLSPRTVVRFDSAEEPPPTDVVVARWEWPEGERLGAVRMGSLLFPDNAVWVLPGQRQDDLIADGMAERPVDDVVLRSYAYDLTVVDAPAPGSTCGRTWRRCTVRVELTNLGEDTWSPLDSLAGSEGTVRVVAWWVTGDQVLPQYVELPRSVHPGYTLDLDVVLDPPDGTPRGAARVELGLEQVGVPGFPGPGVDLPEVDVVR
ncbi:hypothetical protein OEB99_07675 [Actinotalea sp. M2MS4P-6]|uniref:hypothetical protein n=1 Tax=Actinotalea sp. M2MS4P-6 TaxID=2983762 RepID=UPI0021E44364|nr:hypothetical protein [Actinotalea sp. M2MS4P-6]MCV2394182.1 hypothetical protein [Actinotalea sp. M2MS4P-6]